MYNVSRDKDQTKEVIFMKKNLATPGTDNVEPGEWVETGPRGGKLDKPRVVHIDKGDRLPPTSKRGNKWEHK